MNWWKNLIIDPNGRHSDEMAVLCIFGVVIFFFLSVFAVVWRGQPFDPQSYGIGLGAAIGTAAAGMGLKSKMESREDHDVRPEPEQH